MFVFSDSCCLEELFWKKTVDTTAETRNFDYLNIIYFKGTPSFEDMCS